MYSYLWAYLKHQKELLVGHLKSLYLQIVYPQTYEQMKKIRGNYKKLLKEIKQLLKSNDLACDYISRVKTIYSINRKYTYCQIKKRNFNTAITDFIGAKILPKTYKDCHKAAEIILANYKLQIVEGMKNPENFFGPPQKMRDTDSQIKNQIYIKILYENSPAHIMIQPQSEISSISKDRAKYIQCINKALKEYKRKN